MKEDNIRILKVEPQKEPEVVTLKNDLESMQEAVGGLIEIIDLSETACVLCNEEGKLNGLEGNRSLGNDILVGTFYVTGSDYDGNLCSLSDAEITEYSNQFLEPETFKPEEIEAATGFTFLSF
ncbi:hypothetical protein CKN99_13050 [Carnobacterium maltaromaticum]|uniref:DUF3846 domain-containing protein n=1 Tax=Carnobacterium maltaromaticum TaxID=2751 RepID=UPI001071AB6F|nr:DUF3846 domain-containing protein [Carnobacterium maltaromaticum]MDT1943978.1 DUF3846 domain-containing protein [Carnobacterium maltaromaticum]MDT1999358.1 DUF3846 domain-containing protein [Carnobacterium maltaromaticum]TFJ24220.1 hypothetical protein CKN90_13010 [Carnobacterium maltaromaticum]TFJ29625.1 hypothetical protein CKN98_13015 [Carnobacterium maltaromaticum]TFJ32763.1 hypothetical protein CKN88_12970 [Carnobacterium maltaromaticum]